MHLRQLLRLLLLLQLHQLLLLQLHLLLQLLQQRVLSAVRCELRRLRLGLSTDTTDTAPIQG